jgi:CPA1 family monovalent cation:H+ antiporter
MSSEYYFKLILLTLVAIVGLELLAKRLKLPPAAAQLMGGIGIAFLPGLPLVEIDPELILLIFLPPLLMDGAYTTVWGDFKRNISGILLLAIGAVIFTTLVIGVVCHWLVPAMPWGACFAMGAILSPPDAISAKAVLQRVRLPRKIMILLEGESMLNDATGLVLYKFSVVAALTGAFSWYNVTGDFVLLALGGVAVGALTAYATIKLLKYLDEVYLVIVTSILPAWLCFILAEKLEVSGVIATVTYGMILGWFQHEVFSAATRRRGTAFWQILIFILESFVFILIGLSLRGVFDRLSNASQTLGEFEMIIAAIVLTVLVSRFVWVFAIDALASLLSHIRQKNPVKLDWRFATIKSWVGMRGVVTLAIALSLPPNFPGRDLILITAFIVILVTVLLQGTTIGLLIKRLNIKAGGHTEPAFLTESQGWAKIEAAQFEMVKELAYDEKGQLQHPRLLEQYGYRANISNLHKDNVSPPMDLLTSHYDIVLAAIAAGRQELLKLHRAGELHDELLHIIERDLDIQEIAATHNRNAYGNHAT